MPGGKTLRQSVRICGSHAVNEGEWQSPLQIRDALCVSQSEDKPAPVSAYPRITLRLRMANSKASADSRRLRRLHGAESICANLCKSADLLVVNDGELRTIAGADCTRAWQKYATRLRRMCGHIYDWGAAQQLGSLTIRDSDRAVPPKGMSADDEAALSRTRMGQRLRSRSNASRRSAKC